MWASASCFGLYDWKFEVLALLQHIRHLEQTFGVGPHTISVPRMEPAAGSDVAARPPHAVSDADFEKIVAILRLAVPYTGIIMSTRENPRTRRADLRVGCVADFRRQPLQPGRLRRRGCRQRPAVSVGRSLVPLAR